MRILQDFKIFIYCYFVRFRMFVTFTYLFLFVVDTDLRSVCVGTSPWIWFALHGTRFSRMFWKIAVWTQSATDDPKLNLFFLFHGTSDSPPMKGYIRQCTANIQEVLEVHVC